MKALFKILVAVSVPLFLLTGCAGMNMQAGGIGKHGAGFISADGRGMPMQRNGYGQPMMQQGYGQPVMVQGGQPVAYGQPIMAYQGQMQQQGYPVQYGQPMPAYYGGGYDHHGGGVRTAPCQPFNADGLMAWAQGADGASTHSRSASVSNNNGRVNCYSSESASSSGTRRPVAVQMPVVAQPQPAPQPIQQDYMQYRQQGK